MNQRAVHIEQPAITVQGGFLRSLENHVAIIRALGFETQIKIFQSSAEQYQVPLTILIENIRGYEVEIAHLGVSLYNVIRSETSVIFEVQGYTTQKIRLRYPRQSSDFDFFFLGDIHGAFHHFREIVDTANRRNPLFIMVNGDLTHSGHLEDYHEFANLVSQSHVPCFTSIGNHDKRVRGGRMTYRKMFAPFYYTFSFANIKFIVLDSSRKRGLQKFQYKWLERELQLARGKRIFVILHRPPVCPRYNYLSFSATTNIRRFLSLMEAYQVELVLGSHIHVFTEFNRRRVRYVISGGGGGALWQPSNIHHYLHVFVRSGEVDVNILSLPTPEAKVGQRLKDAIKFNLEFHLQRSKMFKQALGPGIAFRPNDSVQQTKRRRWLRSRQ